MRLLVIVWLAFASTLCSASVITAQYSWVVNYVSDPAANALLGQTVAGTFTFDEAAVAAADEVRRYRLSSHTITIDGNNVAGLGSLNPKGNRRNSILVTNNLHGAGRGDSVVVQSTVNSSYSGFDLQAFGLVFSDPNPARLGSASLTKATFDVSFELEDGRLLIKSGGNDIVVSSQSALTFAASVGGGIPSNHVFADATLNTFVSAPGTDLESVLPIESFSAPVTYPNSVKTSPGPMFGAWNGGAWNETESEMHVMASGGHADYCGNEHVKFDVDDLAWTVLRGPTTDFTGFDSGNAQVAMADGRPYSRHTYGGQLYMPNLNKYLLAGGSLCSGAGTMGSDRWLISPDGQTTTLVAGDVHWKAGMQLEYDPVNQAAYLVWGGTWYQLDNTTMDFGTSLYSGASKDTSRMGTSIDSVRRKILLLGNGSALVFDMDIHTVTSFSTANNMDLIKDCNAPGIEYASHIDKHVAWCGGNDVYLIDPVSFTVTTQTMAGTPPGSLDSVGNGIYGRFRYSEKYGGIVIARSIDTDVHFLKLYDTGIVGSLPSIFPQYTDLSPQTEAEQTPLGITSSVGDHGYIGLYTEWQAEYLATGRHEDHILVQADDLLGLPWCDQETMLAKEWQVPEGDYYGNLSFSHLGNYFFMPYLMTSDTKYLAPMECIWSIYQQTRQNFEYAAMFHSTARDAAWTLRNLASLAYVEKHHGTTSKPPSTKEESVRSALYIFWQADWRWQQADRVDASHVSRLVMGFGASVKAQISGVDFALWDLDGMEAELQAIIDLQPLGSNERFVLEENLSHIQDMRAGTVFPYYQTALEHTRQKMLLDMVQPVQQEFHALGVKSWGNPTMTGWMESFIGQVVNHIVVLFPDLDWIDIATWQFEHIETKCGGSLGMIYCDNDAISAVTDWTDTPMYSQEKLDLLVGYPTDELPPIKIGTTYLTFYDRIDNLRSWAALAASNGIPGAQATYDKIQAAIILRDGADGGENWYKYSIEVPE